MPQDSGTQVNIFGQVFHIKGGNDADQTRQLAALVDQKADEYANLKQEHDRLKAEVILKAAKIDSLLDQIETEPREGTPLFAAAD